MKNSVIIPFGSVKIMLIFYTMCYLLPILYVFCRIYYYNPDPLTIPRAAFDVLENKKVAPPGLRVNVNERSGKIDPNNITPEEIQNLNVISYCQPGECVVDKKTGIKRCPVDNGLDGLVYNNVMEVCSEKYSCTDSELFYSVLPDNSTSEDGFCQNIRGEQVACNCSKYKKCPSILSSYFNIKNGIYRAEKTKNPYISNHTINPSDFSAQYCKLNIGLLSFSDFSINFGLAEGYPMGCEYNNTVQQKSPEVTQSQLLNNNSRVLYFDNENKTLIANVNEPEIIQRSGFFTIENERYFYTGITPYFGGNSSVIHSEFKNVYKNSVEDIGDIKGEKISFDSSFTFFSSLCYDIPSKSVTNPWVSQDYLQYEKNQVCIEGTLAYTSKSNDPGKFCSYDNLDGNINEGSYLKDPAISTVSCMPGSGCGQTIDISLCEQKLKEDTEPSPGNIIYNCTESYQTKLKSFLGDVDYSGLNNVFKIPLAKNEIEIVEDNGFIEYTEPVYKSLGDDNFYKIEIYNSYLLNLQPGDYFKISSDFYGLVGSLPGDTVPLPGPFGIDDLGITTCTLRNLPGGKVLPLNSDLGNLTIYKQFGFNGINYDTVGIISPATERSGYLYERKYTESSRWGFIKNFNNEKPNFFMGVFSNDNKKLLYPPYSTDTGNSDDSKDYTKSTFNFNNADFKDKNSMYYPIFNDESYSQICTMCNPYLVAFGKNYTTNEGKNVLENVHIQFSSQDFGNYIPIPKEPKDLDQYENDKYYNYNMFIDYKLNFFIKTSRGLISNTDIIYLDEPNHNIEIGDFIIDEHGFYDKQFIFIPQKIGDFVTKTEIEINLLSNRLNEFTSKDFDFLTPEDCYVPFEGLGTRETSIKKEKDNVYKVTEEKKNYFAGKKYYPREPEQPTNVSSVLNEENQTPLVYFMIKPVIKIIGISKDKKIIYTSVNNRKKLKKNSKIQVIKNSDILEVEACGPEKMCKDLYITGITNKRITSLSVKDYDTVDKKEGEEFLWNVKIKQYKKLR